MSDCTTLYENFFDALGIRENDLLFISSDIANMAKYFKSQNSTFEVTSFLDILQNKVVDGTIVIPAYTDNLRSGDVFDYLKSKPTTGALSNRVGKRRDFTRTFDPLHSVYVWGKDKKELINLSDETSFGEKSIFGYLAKNNAKFIFMDVDLQNSFTFIHYLEQKENVRYRKFYPLNIHIKNDKLSSSRLILFHTKRMGISTNLFPLQKYLLELNILKEIQFGQAKIFMADANSLKEGVAKAIKNGIKFHRFNLYLFGKQLIKKCIGKIHF